MTPTALKPTNEQDAMKLYGLGAERPGNLAWSGAVIGIDFFHPDLPKVQSVGAVGVFAMTAKDISPSWPFGTWRKVAAFALGVFLLLPLATHAQPAACKVNVSTCAAAECSLLPGIGPAKGAAIEAAHPANEAALDAVPGIGEKTLEKLRPFLAYGTEPTTCTSKQGRLCYEDESLVNGKCVPLDEQKDGAK